MGGGAEQDDGTDPAAQFQRVTKVTEIVRNSWCAVMALSAIVMLIAGFIGLVAPRRGRRWLLASGFVIILATIGTMAGILVLIRYGDFPNMKAPAYVLITGAQSSLGWVLVFTCRRRRDEGASAHLP
jgi:hypothetical protein